MQTNLKNYSTEVLRDDVFFKCRLLTAVQILWLPARVSYPGSGSVIMWLFEASAQLPVLLENTMRSLVCRMCQILTKAQRAGQVEAPDTCLHVTFNNNNTIKVGIDFHLAPF